MGYIKTDWKNLPTRTTPVTKGNLNHMEQGIYDATYENGLNVSNEVDEDYRVNLLKGKNLFDKNSGIISGYYYSSTGALTVDTNYSSQTIFIEVKPNTKYTLSSQNADLMIMCEYDSNKNFIERKYTSPLVSNITYTTGSTTKYIKVSVRNENISSYQLEKGDTATTYESYIIPSIVVDNEEIYSKDNIDNLLAFEDRIDVRTYSKFLNTSSSSSFGITIKGDIDRHAFLVMGVNNAMGSILSIITSSSNVTNVKNLGTVNLSASRSGNNITVSGMGTYTYVYVIGYDDFTLYR